MRAPDDKAEAHSRAARAGGPLPRLRVRDLMGGEREVILEHGGQDYHLRITASGKLILTK